MYIVGTTYHLGMHTTCSKQWNFISLVFIIRVNLRLANRKTARQKEKLLEELKNCKANKKHSQANRTKNYCINDDKARNVGLKNYA